MDHYQSSEVLVLMQNFVHTVPIYESDNTCFEKSNHNFVDGMPKSNSLSDENVLKNENSYCCSKCGKLFSSKLKLYQHNYHSHPSQEKIQNYKCSFCSKQFPYSFALAKHVSTTHKSIDSYFQCKICKKMFKTKSNLKKHDKIKHKNI